MNDRILIKTGKIGNLNIAEQTSRIVEDTLAKEQQSETDINKLIYIFGIVGSILASTQAWKIYVLKSAFAVSSIYWGAYLVVAVMWFGYGIYYKNKAVMLVYGLWIVIILFIMNGIFLF